MTLTSASTRRVLAVDDDRLLLMTMRTMLEDLGHTVFEAISGSEALGVLTREKAIDLVVTDQSMPGMTGVELVESIRAITPEMPIIVVTGYAELPPGIEVVKLHKPFFPEELAQAIACLTSNTPT